MIVEAPTLAADVDLVPLLERSTLLSSIPWLRHGITRRVAGLGKADGNVGYSAPRDEDDAWDMRQRWARAVGVDPCSLVRVRQLHGNLVHVATTADLERGPHPAATGAPVADAIVTNIAGLALMTLHADCLAMLLVDPRTRSVAAVHAGWRSTVADIASETVRAMQTAFGTQPGDLLAYVGPSIGVERYQVGPEVIEAWKSLHPVTSAIRSIDGGSNFDLKRANAERLAANGVLPDNIEISQVCTATDSETWFSHRGQGPLTGRFAAIVAIAESGDRR